MIMLKTVASSLDNHLCPYMWLLLPPPPKKNNNRKRGRLVVLALQICYCCWCCCGCGCGCFFHRYFHECIFLVRLLMPVLACRRAIVCPALILQLRAGTLQQACDLWAAGKAIVAVGTLQGLLGACWFLASARAKKSILLLLLQRLLLRLRLFPPTAWTIGVF